MLLKEFYYTPIAKSELLHENRAKAVKKVWRLKPNRSIQEVVIDIDGIESIVLFKTASATGKCWQ